MNKQIFFAFLLAFYSGAAFSAAPDLSSPETTLASYIGSLSSGDKTGVLACIYGMRDFYVPGPMPLDKYTIVKKIAYTEKETEKWNTAGIKPEAKVGDVELQVKEIEQGKPQMYSYNLRKFENGWLIISLAAWGVD